MERRWEVSLFCRDTWHVRLMPEVESEKFNVASFWGPNAQAMAEVYRDFMNAKSPTTLVSRDPQASQVSLNIRPVRELQPESIHRDSVAGEPEPEIWERHRILIQAPDGHTIVSDLSAEVAVLHSAEGKSVAFWGPNPQKRMEIYKGNVVPPTFPIEKLGIYRIHWTEEAGGGLSVAAVGQDEAGNYWFAPTNWVGGKGRVPSFCWKDVAKVELITTQKAQEELIEVFGWDHPATKTQPISFPDESIVLEMHGSEHELFKITKFECRMLTGPLLGLAGEFVAKGLEGQEHVGKECTFHGVRTDACVGKFQAILVSWNPCGFYTFESTRSFTRPEPVYGEFKLKRTGVTPEEAVQKAIAAMTDEQAGAVIAQAKKDGLTHFARLIKRVVEFGSGEEHRPACGYSEQGVFPRLTHNVELVTCQACHDVVSAAFLASGDPMGCADCRKPVPYPYMLCKDCLKKSADIFREEVQAREIPELCHFAPHYGKVACGADVPNMQSTIIVQNVTCGRCIKTEIFGDRVKVALAARAAPQQIQEAIAELEEVKPDHVRDA